MREQYLQLLDADQNLFPKGYEILFGERKHRLLRLLEPGSSLAEQQFAKDFILFAPALHVLLTIPNDPETARQKANIDAILDGSGENSERWWSLAPELHDKLQHNIYQYQSHSLKLLLNWAAHAEHSLPGVEDIETYQEPLL